MYHFSVDGASDTVKRQDSTLEPVRGVPRRACGLALTFGWGQGHGQGQVRMLKQPYRSKPPERARLQVRND